MTGRVEGYAERGGMILEASAIRVAEFVLSIGASARRALKAEEDLRAIGAVMPASA